MPLFLGSPSNWQELDEAFAAIQTWVGKQEGEGKWTAVEFDAGAFAADTGSWTVTSADQRVFKYMIVGDTMTVQFYLADTTIAGTPSDLRIRIPAGYVATTLGCPGVLCAFGTVGAVAVVETRDGLLARYLSCFRVPIVAWANATDAQTLVGSITFQVNRP